MILALEHPSAPLLGPVLGNGDASMPPNLSTIAWARPPSPSANIRLVEIGLQGKAHDVSDKAYFTIGRNDKCHIQVENLMISRFHAALVHHENGETYLVDLGSVHGSFVGSERLVPYVPTLLKRGSVLRFGAKDQFILKEYPSIASLLVERERSERKRGCAECLDIDSDTSSGGGGSSSTSSTTTSSAPTEEEDDESCLLLNTQLNRCYTSSSFILDEKLLPLRTSSGSFSGSISSRDSSPAPMKQLRIELSRSETLDFTDMPNQASFFDHLPFSTSSSVSSTSLCSLLEHEEGPGSPTSFSSVDTFSTKRVRFC